MKQPKFELGQVVATSTFLEAIPDAHDHLVALFEKHAKGDWGVVDADDWKANNRALAEGERIVSAYVASNGKTFWIITEADRSVTTFLLPEDY